MHHVPFSLSPAPCTLYHFSCTMCHLQPSNIVQSPQSCNFIAVPDGTGFIVHSTFDIPHVIYFIFLFNDIVAPLQGAENQLNYNFLSTSGPYGTDFIFHFAFFMLHFTFFMYRVPFSCTIFHVPYAICNLRISRNRAISSIVQFLCWPCKGPMSIAGDCYYNISAL